MTETAQGAARWLPAARAGSREALGQLLEACRAYLLLIAQRELDPDLRAKGGASDLVQETFLEAQRDFRQFRGDSEAELLGWLRQMLLNNLAGFTRRYRETAKRRVACEVALEAAHPPGAGPAAGADAPGEQAIAREQREEVRRALGRLPEHYRQVLLLRYEEELPFEEIGRRLGRSANAARKLWARALEQMQTEMESPHAG